MQTLEMGTTTATTGPRASTVGTGGNPYRYVGQLGYYYHWQAPSFQDWLQLGVRFYNPSLGRFERRDPVDAPAVAAYPYANAQPLTRLDPDGRFPIIIPIGIVIGCAIVGHCKDCMLEAADNARAAEKQFRRKGHYGKDTGRDAPNAVKHCIWACLGRKTCGLSCARNVVSGWEFKHVVWHDKAYDDSGMDLVNDDEGLGCGADHKSSCYDCCVGKLRSGRLIHF